MTRVWRSLLRALFEQRALESDPSARRFVAVLEHEQAAAAGDAGTPNAGVLTHVET